MYTYPIRSDELYHHGVKGMHWGVRRYQNPDGTLTSAGRSHYGVETKTRAQGIKQRSSEFRYARNKRLETKKKYKTGQVTRAEYKKSKKDEKEAREKLNQVNYTFTERTGRNYVSNRSKELREKTKGELSVSESRKLSEQQKETIKKIAIASGITAAVAVGGYAAYRYYGRNVMDKVIKQGTTIQTLSRDADRLSKGQSFFTTYKDKDKLIYEGLFGDVNDIGGRGKEIINANITNDIKVASRKNANEVYQQLKKNNPEFKELVRDIQIKGKRRVGGLTNDAKKYDAFNYHSLGTGDSSPETKRANEIFFDALKKAGYGGVTDVNDMKYSRLRGDSPVIIFDKKNVDLSNIKVQNIADKYDTSVYVKDPTGLDRRNYWGSVKKEANALSLREIALDNISDHPVAATGRAWLYSTGIGMTGADIYYNAKAKKIVKDKNKDKKK